MTTPYSRATSTNAREDVTAMLREQIGIEDGSHR